MLRQAEKLLAVLQAIVALDAWNDLEVLQHAPWLGRLLCATILRQAGITIGGHLAAVNPGVKTIPVDRRRHRETRLLALARTMMERKLLGRRTSSKLPELVKMVMAKPLVSAGMIAKELGVTPRAALRIGSHTFSFINDTGERVWTKFHWSSLQGIENLTDDEAARVIGGDRESHQRDLYEALERGDYPRWVLSVQVMTEAQATSHRHDAFDLTKVWPKADYPLIEVGVMELNRNPDNVFAEVEQAAFSPANVVPGIGFSPDRMLQARLFSYGDAQRYRLGVNHMSIPVNAPKCPYHSYHRDGQMRVDGNAGSTIAYYPNSKAEWETGSQIDPPLPLDGAADHYDYRVINDHYEQPGNLFRLMSPEQQRALFENTARAMGEAGIEVKQRHVDNCTRADPAYGAGVARALGFPLNIAAE